MRASGFSVSVTKKRKKKCIITCNSQCWKALTEWRRCSSLLSPNHRKTGENYCVKCRRTFQSPVHWDSVNHWINLHPLDNAIGFRNTYPLNSGLSGEWRYPSPPYWTKRTWSWIQYPSSKDSSERERIFCCRLFTSYLERECGQSHVVVVQRWQKKVQKKCAASAEMLFYCFVNVIAAVAVVGS